MATEFEFTDPAFDLVDVQARLAEVLGERVAVVAGWPSGDRPGTLRFELDVEGDEPPLDLDPTLVEQVLADARSAERERDLDPGPGVVGQMLVDLRAARSESARTAVLERLLEHLAVQEQAEWGRAQEGRRAFRDSRVRQMALVPQDQRDNAFVSPRDTTRPGVLFTRAQREERAREAQSSTS